MKLIIATQVYENYGAHDWDGKGLCPQYWKAKGGSEYTVEGITIQQAQDRAVLQDMVARACAEVERQDDYYEEKVIDWSLEEDDFLTWDERNQLEYEGQITYPSPKLVLREPA